MTNQTSAAIQTGSAPADVREARLATPRGFEPPIRSAALGRGTGNADLLAFESVGDENTDPHPQALAVSRHLTGSPVARHMERSGRTDTPSRSCPCGAPATHAVKPTGEVYVPAHILPSLCFDCACTRSYDIDVKRAVLKAQAEQRLAEQQERESARCSGCKRLMRARYPFKAEGKYYHRRCWANGQNEIAALRSLALEDANPLKGLLW